MKKMDRRAFLKLAPKAAVGLTLTGLGVAGSEKLRKKEEERIIGVNEAIEKFLGVKKGKSTIEFNLMYHVLSAAAGQKILDSNCTVVLGELVESFTQKQYLLDAIDNLDSGLNTINTKNLFSLGIGSSKEEKLTHYKILLSILENRSQHLVVTDPGTGYLYSEETDFRDSLAKKEGIIALGVGAITISTIFSYIEGRAIKNKRKMTRRSLIKDYIYMAMVAAAATSIGDFIRLNTSDTNELRNKFVPLASAIDTPDRKKEYIYNPDKDNPWISYSEMLLWL